MDALTHFVQDVRFGLRTLVKTPTFTTVAMAVLALGIGANSAMFTLVNALLIRPLAGRTELVGLYSRDRAKPDNYRGFSYPNYADLRGRNDVFEALMAHTFSMVGVPAGDGMRRTFVEVVTANYFDTLGVSLAAGRAFMRDEERPGSRIPVAIVRRDRADLLGRTVRINAIDFTVVGVAPPGFTGTMALITPEISMDAGPERQPLEIVGVAAPIRDQLFDREAGPAIYVPYGRNYRSMASIHVRAAQGGSDAGVLTAIRGELRAMDPRLPVVSATTMTGFHERSLELWAISAGGRMFLVLGGLALLLAVVGLYGVKAYIVSQRTREIGVRMALGARPRDVMGMLWREGAALSAAGIALGLPRAALLGAALGSVLYDVKPLDPLVLSLAPALPAVAALIATWLPARRATRITPLTATHGLTSRGDSGVRS